jgi:hypothetical protein
MITLERNEYYLWYQKDQRPLFKVIFHALEIGCQAIDAERFEDIADKCIRESEKDLGTP